MDESFLSNNNLEALITKLNISKEQRSFLMYELPKMNKAERLELFSMLRNVCFLEAEKKQTIKKIKSI